VPLQKTSLLRWPFEVLWLPVGDRLQREDGRLKGFGCASSSKREAAVAMCYEGGEGAFSAKL
jgi:ubiquitin